MGAISRSLPLAVLVMVLTVAISFAAGMAFRTRFFGSGPLFYLVIASLVAPGYVLGIGIGLDVPAIGLGHRLVHLGARRTAVVDPAVRTAYHVCGIWPLQPIL